MPRAAIVVIEVDAGRRFFGTGGLPKRCICRAAPAICQSHPEFPAIHTRSIQAVRQYPARRNTRPQMFSHCLLIRGSQRDTREPTLEHAISCAFDLDRFECCIQRGAMSAIAVHSTPSTAATPGFPFMLTRAHDLLFPSSCTPLLPCCLLTVDVWSHDFAFCERDHNTAA